MNIRRDHIALRDLDNQGHHFQIPYSVCCPIIL